MEIVHQIIDKEGLNIPLPIIEQYGMHPGVNVVLELEKDGIRIRPAKLNQSEIENLALIYLLANVGDGVRVRASQENGNWQVSVISFIKDSPLGYLYFSQYGSLIEENSITPAELLALKN